MAISKSREKASRNPVVRTRPAGTPVVDNRVPTDEREYVDVELGPDGHTVVTDKSTLPRF